MESAALEVSVATWAVLAVVVAISLAADFLGHRRGRGLGRGHAIAWSVGWIVVALAFAAWVAARFGGDAAEDFVTAYLIEKSLSLDNVFVFLVLFGQLRVPEAQQRRVLFWGILGALAARAAFIGAGTALLSAWHGLVYVLGAFLVYTGIKAARAEKEDAGAGQGRVATFVARHLPTVPELHGDRFFVRRAGKLLATPLFVALVVIELTDVVFALDSIPAVLAVSEEPFIVYASNVFAMLGLRALYVVLADLLRGLRYVRHGLAAILVLAGAKMLVSHHVHVPHAVSLGAILLVLTVTVVASLIARRRALAPPTSRA